VGENDYGSNALYVCAMNSNSKFEMEMRSLRWIGYVIGIIALSNKQMAINRPT